MKKKITLFQFLHTFGQACMGAGGGAPKGKKSIIEHNQKVILVDQNITHPLWHFGTLITVNYLKD